MVIKTNFCYNLGFSLHTLISTRVSHVRVMCSVSFKIKTNQRIELPPSLACSLDYTKTFFFFNF